MPKGEYLQYGGQAIIEGVMMRSPNYFSVACRAPNGQIVHKTEHIEKTWIGRQKWLKLPFLRGSLALLDSMALGIKAMRFATNVQLDSRFMTEEELAKQKPVAGGGSKMQDAPVLMAMVVGIGLGLSLFNLLPNVISAVMSDKLGIKNYIAINVVTEVIKITFLLAYLWGIGQVKEIQKIFMYHGAEHKAINTLEADQALTFENCKAQTRLHPRCGTSFAIIVLIVSLILMPLVPRPTLPLAVVNGLLRFLIEIPLLFIVAGISYEALRMAGKFRNSSIIKTLFAPGLMSQYLTTREPVESQIEVALEALKAVIKAEESGEHEENEVVLESSPIPVPIP